MAECKFCGNETYSDRVVCGKCKKEFERRVEEMKRGRKKRREKNA